jgi:hypothetical protein
MSPHSLCGLPQLISDAFRFIVTVGYFLFVTIIYYTEFSLYKRLHPIFEYAAAAYTALIFHQQK